VINKKSRYDKAEVWSGAREKNQITQSVINKKSRYDKAEVWRGAREKPKSRTS